MTLLFNNLFVFPNYKGSNLTQALVLNLEDRKLKKQDQKLYNLMIKLQSLSDNKLLSSGKILTNYSLTTNMFILIFDYI